MPRRVAAGCRCVGRLLVWGSYVAPLPRIRYELRAHLEFDDVELSILHVHAFSAAQAAAAAMEELAASSAALLAAGGGHVWGASGSSSNLITTTSHADTTLYSHGPRAAGVAPSAHLGGSSSGCNGSSGGGCGGGWDASANGAWGGWAGDACAEEGMGTGAAAGRFPVCGRYHLIFPSVDQDARQRHCQILQVRVLQRIKCLELAPTFCVRYTLMLCKGVCAKTTRGPTPAGGGRPLPAAALPVPLVRPPPGHRPPAQPAAAPRPPGPSRPRPGPTAPHLWPQPSSS